MSRFKAGDLALIIGGRPAENTGKTVTLVAAVPPGRHNVNGQWCTNDSQILVWLCSGDGLMAEMIDTDTRERGIYPHDVVLKCESHLMPLKGDPDQLNDNETEPVKQTVGVTYQSA